MSREKLVDTLRKVMALMDSPNENEAQAAAAHLARLLEKHNMEVADLEAAGQEVTEVEAGGDQDISSNPLNDPTVAWKVSLAECVAEHFYCYADVPYVGGRVRFIGRRENLDSLELLYEWFIKQIKRLAKADRRRHLEETGQDIPGIRWQMSFAEGVIERLGERLHNERERHATAGSTSLVVSRTRDISDWMETNRGWRMDGQKTERQAEREQDYRDLIARKAQLLKDDPIAYYDEFPQDHPDRVAEREFQDAARQKRVDAKERRNEGRRRRYREARDGTRDTLKGVEQGTFGGDRYAAYDWEKDDQETTARQAGRERGDDINLRPHLDGDDPERKKLS